MASSQGGRAPGGRAMNDHACTAQTPLVDDERRRRLSQCYRLILAWATEDGGEQPRAPHPPSPGSTDPSSGGSQAPEGGTS
jgi:hypothetical protein